MGGQRSRTTFAKLQRERAKQEKQRLKREARLERKDAPRAEEEELKVIDPNDPAYIARMTALAEGRDPDVDEEDAASVNN